MNRTAKVLIGSALLMISCCLWAQNGWSLQAEKGAVLRAMEEEMGRSMNGLKEKGNPSPYYIGYSVTETKQAIVGASYGAVRSSVTMHSRLLDVDVRVGDYRVDNTHRLRGGFDFRSMMSRPVPVPLEDDLDALKSTIWLETDKKYKSAVERLVQVQSEKVVKVKEEDESDDFSRESPEKHLGRLAQIEVDVASWEEKVKRYSALFNDYPEIYESNVTMMASATNKYLLNSEGTAIQHGKIHWHLSLYARTRADDGMILYRFESFDGPSSKALASDKAIREAAARMAEDLLALRAAPVIEPYNGPAIMSGRAAAVFFHEIFGHRIEGHRQKDEKEGQTFTKKINQAVLPDFVSVYDDPTEQVIGQTHLNGHYLYDDEGVKAQRVTVVDKGVLKNFLMSRSPVAGFDKSNGHGRKQPGYRAVSRQGNLIVEASKTVSEKKLRKLLIQECKKQDKPFGLIFKDISGGMTNTGRGAPQAYAVVPILVYRVFTDGRADELVRGADLIGTPLLSLSNILACGKKQEVFNGSCGAESGNVLVSGVSPSILTSEIEIQKKQKSPDRPPLLPPPPARRSQ